MCKMVYKTKKYKLADLGFLGRRKSNHRPSNDISLFGAKYPLIHTGEIKAANLYISEYENVGDHLKIYTVDLDDSFNVKYIGEEENLQPENISEFRITNN